MSLINPDKSRNKRHYQILTFVRLYEPSRTTIFTDPDPPQKKTLSKLD